MHRHTRRREAQTHADERASIVTVHIHTSQSSYADESVQMVAENNNTFRYSLLKDAQTCQKKKKKFNNARGKAHTGASSLSKSPRLSCSEVCSSIEKCRAPEKHSHAVLRSRGMSQKSWPLKQSVNCSVAPAPLLLINGT